MSADDSGAGFIARSLDRNPPYVLVRFVLLRALALVYLVAFSVAAFQAVPLIGAGGLLPVPSFRDAVLSASGGARDAFLQLPTLFGSVTPMRRCSGSHGSASRFLRAFLRQHGWSQR